MKTLEFLKNFQGTYQGESVNHEGQPFHGLFQLTPLIHGKGYQIQFTATSLDSQKKLFHDEVSILAPGIQGGFSLFNLNSNIPFLCEHRLVSTDQTAQSTLIKFRFGNIEDKISFREEILLELTADSARYEYSWGLPGGDFAPRSGVRMKKVSS